ncbi:MAG TPA: ParB N-terminal domain-containing protein [Pseudonocardiaceae bacterium]
MSASHPGHTPSTPPQDDPHRIPDPATDPAADLALAVDGWSLAQVNPADLVIGPNVRTDVTLDRQFVASIRRAGVQQPIVVRRDTQGRLVVRTRQRRALAAAEAGRTTVLVVVDPTPHGDEPQDQAERIVDQLVENAQREANTELDVISAHQQLLDLGLTAGQIARRTSTTPAVVKRRVAVATTADPRAATKELADLRPGPDHTPGSELTDEDHAGCPGHVVRLEDHQWQPMNDPPHRRHRRRRLDTRLRRPQHVLDRPTSRPSATSQTVVSERTSTHSNWCILLV